MLYKILNIQLSVGNTVTHTHTHTRTRTHTHTKIEIEVKRTAEQNISL